MKTLTALGLAALFCLGAPAQTGDAFTSPAAKAAKAKFDKAAAELHKRHAQEAAELRQVYVRELTAARAEALKANNLEEAQRIVAAIKEQEEALKAPESEPGPGGRLVVITARYGADERWTDVTKQVRSLVRGNRLAIPSVEGLPDPAFGVRKALVIVYSVDGSVQTEIRGDGQPVLLPKKR
jgi:hypothetical protein